MVHAHNMKHQMKNRYRVFRRGWGAYYCEDLVTKKQTTLKTRDKDEAFRLVAAKNETEEAPAFIGPTALPTRYPGWRSIQFVALILIKSGGNKAFRMRFPRLSLSPAKKLISF